MRRTRAATPTWTPTPSRRTSSACTEAGITAGFHVIGDAAVTAVVDALDRVAERFGAPAIARCGHRLEHLEMVTAEQAARLGALGVVASMQPNFDALWGGAHGMYAQRLGADRARRLNPFALLASQGVPLAFGSDSPVTSMNPWATVRAATSHQTQGSAISARAAFAAATRGSWRAGGVRDGVAGTLVPGAPASYAVWDVPGGGASRSRRRRTPCSAGPPIRGPGCPPCPDSAPTIRCRRAARRCTGASSSMADRRRRRDWSRPADVTDILPAVQDMDVEDPEDVDAAAVEDRRRPRSRPEDADSRSRPTATRPRPRRPSRPPPGRRASRPG